MFTLVIFLMVIGGISFLIFVANVISVFSPGHGNVDYLFKSSFIAAICFGILYMGEILQQLVQ